MNYFCFNMIRLRSKGHCHTALSDSASEQAMFTESVTMVTDSDFQLPLFLEGKTQRFPHLKNHLL